jgi:hypothetical protein
MTICTVFRLPHPALGDRSSYCSLTGSDCCAHRITIVHHSKMCYFGLHFLLRRLIFVVEFDCPRFFMPFCPRMSQTIWLAEAEQYAQRPGMNYRRCEVSQLTLANFITD